MIPFERYPSIENSYREKMIHKIELMGITEWVAHEKIHGANFSIWYDGTEVKFGKRSGFIGEGADFFKFQKLIPELTELARDTWKHYHLKDGQNLVIYGELFGGMYPHPDVERMLDVSKIQDTVYYSPDVQFRYFDIVLDGVTLPPRQWPWVPEICKYQVPEVSGGTLDEMLEFNVEQPSSIYTEFSLPEIEGNTMEGVVIRPYSTVPMTRMGERVIIKKKSAKFSERANAPKIKTEAVEIPPEAQELYERVSAYINEARVASVASKIGNVTLKDFKKVREALYKDAVEDFNRDNGSDILGNLARDLHRPLRKAIGALTALVTRDYLTTRT